MKDFKNKIEIIEKLQTAGLLNQQQGIELLNVAAKRLITNNVQKPSVLPENSSISAFFTTESRKNLRDFFQNNFKLGENFDEKTFVKLIENIEKQAISGHEAQKKFDSDLSNSNSVAKTKLTSQAEGINTLGTADSHIFTREEIGKMSLHDYEKNEAQIMAQLEKGLIS